MKIDELCEFAKDKGFDNLEFEFTNLLGEVKKCKWLDAYFGMFIIEGNNGFLTVKQWKETVGDVFEFHVTHYNHCENCQKIRANSKYCIKTVADENRDHNAAKNILREGTSSLGIGNVRLKIGRNVMVEPLPL